MPRETPVREAMTTDVLTFTADENISDAMARLVDAGFDAAPVLDEAGVVIGLLSSGDLIVQETNLHMPTVISLLGATLEWPSSKKKFDHDLERALGSTVGEVMSDELHTCGPDDTIEDAATIMHDHDVSRLPVVDGDGALVGIIARGDILRVIVQDDRSASDAVPASGDDVDYDGDVDEAADADGSD